MASQQVCPIVGTTNTMLPPSHPDFDMEQPGLVCPITNASTDHHQLLSKHPGLPSTTSATDAQKCPVLNNEVQSEEAKKLDEGICPVVGIVSTVLPPDHPTPKSGADICPVTKASLKHHEGKVAPHPSVEGAAEGAVCPVVGKAASKAEL